MLTKILKLLDSFAALPREHRKKDVVYLERYAQPAYDLSKQVFDDYMKLLASLRHRIETGESRQSLLHFLEQARVEYLSARIRLRAMLHYHRGFPEESLFEAGIFRLLHSGLVHLEEGRVVQASYGEDTLLDIMYSVQHANEPVPNYLIIEFIHKQEWTLKHAFEEITLGFEQLRKSIVKKP